MSFSATEVFEIAAQIERNGQNFYEQAARYAQDERLVSLLQELAAMEAEHEKFFVETAEGFDADDRLGSIIDEDSHNRSYIRSIADGHVFDTSLAPQVLITGDEKPAELLNVAVAMEKESIVYYSALRDIVDPGRTVERIDQVIREELSHVAMLNGMKEQFKDE